jgi:hypothetical protein
MVEDLEGFAAIEILAQVVDGAFHLIYQLRTFVRLGSGDLVEQLCVGAVRAAHLGFRIRMAWEEVMNVALEQDSPVKVVQFGDPFSFSALVKHCEGYEVARGLALLSSRQALPY